MKKIFNLVTIFVCLIVFGTNIDVNADSYGLRLLTGNKKVKSGDIIKIDYALSCAAEGFVLDSSEVTLLYDPEVLTFIQNNNSYGVLRDGWKVSKGSFNGIDGMVSVNLIAESYDHAIDNELSSENCDDDINATIITFSFKVNNNINNQKTLISLGTGEKAEIQIYNNDTNNKLNTLTVDKGSLNPEFNPDIEKYTVNVDYDVETITLNGACQGVNCKVSELGEKKLEIGSNEFNITVTSENGIKRNYQVIVIRSGASNDTTLSSLIIEDSNNQNIEVNYNEKNKKYEATVNNDIDFVTFTAECSGVDCKVSELKAKKLQVGKNEFKIDVTAQDNSTQEYIIVINKLAKDNTMLYVIIGVVALVVSVSVATIIIVNKKKKNANFENIV